MKYSRAFLFSIILGFCILSASITYAQFNPEIRIGNTRDRSAFFEKIFHAFDFALPTVAAVSDFDSNLVAHYTFDEGSGTTANDEVGGNDGVLTNGPAWVSGKVGNGALQFDGSNDSVSVAASTDFDFTGDFTVSAWVNANSGGLFIPIVGRSVANASAYWSLSLISGTRLDFSYSPGGANGSSNIEAICSNFTTGSWHHVVGLVSGNSIRCYVDGTAGTSSTIPGVVNLSGRPLQIGATGGQANWNGLIDDVRIYSRALTPSEISDLYALGSGTTPSNPSSTTYTITTSTSGTGGGTITCSGSACPATAIEGSSLTFTATPNSNSTFTSWRGACSGTSSTCTLSNITSNRSITATFTANTTTQTPDTTAPSIPTGLSATAVSSSQINLSWNASTDPTVSGAVTSGVAGYRIYRNGSQVTTVTGTTYSNTGLSASTQYTYTVAAYDGVSNASSQTSGVSATTPAATQTSTSGENFYVTPSGSGLTNGSSWSNAFAGFNDVVWGSGAGQLGAGDTLWIAGGSYGILNIQGSGTANARIYLKRARSSDAAVTSSSGWSSNYDSQPVIDRITAYNGNSYWTLDGQIPYTGIQVRTSSPLNDPNDSYIINLGQTPTEYIELKNIDVAGPIGSNIVAQGGEKRGLHFNYGQSTGHGLYIGYSQFHNMDTLLLTIGMSDMVFEYNKLYSNYKTGANHPNIWATTGTSDTIFRFNEIYNWQAEGIMMGFIGASDRVNSNWYIYGNVWHDGMTPATYYPRVLASQYRTDGPIYLYNNTFVNLWQPITVENGGSWDSRSQSRNNIYWNYIGRGVLYATESNNVAGNGTTNTPFVDYANGDYRLNSVSSAINTGTTISSINGVSFSRDIAGTSRPQGSAWDIGAYEYTGAQSSDTTAPIISSVVSSAVTSSSVIINWTTNELSDSQIEYGPNTAYGNLVSINETLVTLHSQTLSGLTENTTYNYRVRSRDASGNLVTSGNYTFTTSVQTTGNGTVQTTDTIPPSLISITASSITTTSAAISWTTDEPATTQIQYGLSVPYGNTTPLISTLSTSHTQSLTGLSPNTLYNYRVISTDAAGNTSTSANGTFATAANPDTTRPTVSLTSPAGTTISGTVTLSATTADPTGVGQTVSGIQSVQFTIDGVAFGSPLTSPYATTWNTTAVSNGTHVVTATARDNAGNTTTSAPVTVTVSNAIITEITMGNVNIIPLSKQRLQISWTTNVPADATLELGRTNTYGTTLTSASLSTTHTLVTDSLLRGTLYYLRLSSKSATLSTTTSMTYTTPAGPGKLKNLSATAGSIILNWENPAVIDYVDVLIYRVLGTTAVETAEGTPLAVVGTSTTTYHDETVSPETTYSYSLFTRDSDGVTSYSGSITYTSPKEDPAPAPEKKRRSGGGGGGGSRNVPPPNVITNAAALTLFASSVPAAPSFIFTRNLTIGSIGADVKALQVFLNNKGYTVSSTGAGSKGLETTTFGPATQRALARFQAANQITPAAGYFGPSTKAKVQAQSGGASSVTSVTPVIQISTTVPVSTTFTRTLTIGSIGADVKALQVFLNTHGYPVATTGAGSRGYETTTFGPATQRALARFQAANNIIPNQGVFGPVTRERMKGMR